MRFIWILVVSALANNLYAQRILTDTKHLREKRVFFRENKGQVRDPLGHPQPEVLFSGEREGLVYHLKAGGIAYQLHRVEEREDHRPTKLTLHRIDLSFIGGRAAQIIPEEAFPDEEHFYIGGSTIHGVKRYQKLRYKQVWEGVDVVFYEGKSGLEYDFIVHPGANPALIQMHVAGAAVRVEADELVFQTPLGEVREGKPRAYQAGREITCQWKVSDDRVSLALGSYDPSLPLRIDPPVRVWGTYLGGGNYDRIYAMRADASGNIYVVGSTASLSNIATQGAHQVTLSAFYDAFVVKFSSSGQRLWGTYFGGNDDDAFIACAVENTGGLYAVGWTRSSTGIATPSAFQGSLSGREDALIASFTASGQLRWATYLGGTEAERALGCVAFRDTLYVVGHTFSPNFPTTASAHQPTFGGGSDDAFIVKFDPTGQRIWSTFYGGSDGDIAHACAVNRRGELYLAGATTSWNNISTLNSYIGWGGEGFLAKFNAEGTRLWARYEGGAGNDAIRGVEVDAEDFVYVVGVTSSHGMATPYVFQEVFGGRSDAFITKFSTDGERLWSSYYGGSGQDEGAQCAITATGDVYVVGMTYSRQGIASSDAFQDSLAGVSDGFIVRFSPSGQRVWGTYYGGVEQDEIHTCVALGEDVIVGGWSYSRTGLASVGAGQSTWGGYSDGFLARFSDCPALRLSLPDTATVCVGAPLRIEPQVSGGCNPSYTYAWRGPHNFTVSTAVLSFTAASPANSGIYVLRVSDPSGLSVEDTVSVEVITLSSSILAAGGTLIAAPFEGLLPLVLCALSGGSGCELPPSVAQATYTWIDCDSNTVIRGANSFIFTPSRSGRYAVEVRYGGCVDTSECLVGYPLSVQAGESITPLQIFPNPTSDRIYVEGVTGTVPAEIWTSQGTLVLRTTVSAKAPSISLETLPAGLYVLRLLTTPYPLSWRFILQP